MIALLFAALPRKNRFPVRRSFTAKQGAGAIVPGIDGVANVRVVDPVVVQNQALSFAGLAIGAGIGYAVGKLT